MLPTATQPQLVASTGSHLVAPRPEFAEGGGSLHDGTPARQSRRPEPPVQLPDADRTGRRSAEVVVVVRLASPLDSEAFAARIAAEEGFAAVTPDQRLDSSFSADATQGLVLLTDRCGRFSDASLAPTPPTVILVDSRFSSGGFCSCCRRLSKACTWRTLLDAIAQTADRRVAFPPDAPAPATPAAVSDSRVGVGPGGTGAEDRIDTGEGADTDEARRIASLTPRELEVLRLVGLGKSVRQCAEELGVAESTVGNHKYRLMRKLGISTSLEALRIAVRHGLADL